MANIQTIKDKIQGLINKGNEATGNSDVDLTSVVTALISGFGQGGSSGGNDLPLKFGTFTGNSGAKTLQHDLGVVPDFFLVFNTGASTVSTFIMCCGFSTNFYSKISNTIPNPQVGAYRNSSNYYSYSTYSKCIDETYIMSILQNANESTIEIGSSSYKTNGKYYWIAIGGLA